MNTIEAFENLATPSEQKTFYSTRIADDFIPVSLVINPGDPVINRDLFYPNKPVFR